MKGHSVPFDTWKHGLRAMNQSRLNWCMVLHIHKDDTDLLGMQSAANEFDP